MKYFIQLRELYIHIFKKNILIIEKDKQIITNKLIIIPLNLFYFFTQNLLKYFNINVIYELDNLIFYENNKNHKMIINHIMLEFNIINSLLPYCKKNITNNINKYSKYMPFYIIAKIENIHINHNVEIKIMKFGKIITTIFYVNDILDKHLYELL